MTRIFFVICILALALLLSNNINPAHAVRTENIQLQGSSAYTPFQITIQHLPTQNKTIGRTAPALCNSCVFADSVTSMNLSVNETTFYTLNYGLHYSIPINQTVLMGIWSNGKLTEQRTIPVVDRDVLFNILIATESAPRYPTPFELLGLIMPSVSILPDMNNNLRFNTYQIIKNTQVSSGMSLYAAVAATAVVGLVLYERHTGGIGTKTVVKYVMLPTPEKMSLDERSKFKQWIRDKLGEIEKIENGSAPTGANQ